jgi:hypothetical protein
MQVSQLKLTTFLVLAITLALPPPLHAQDDCGVCKINRNVAMVLNMSVSSTARVAGVGWCGGRSRLQLQPAQRSNR